MMAQVDLDLLRLVKDRLETALARFGVVEIPNFKTVLAPDQNKYGCRYLARSQFGRSARIVCNLDLIRCELLRKGSLADECLRTELLRRLAREYGYLMIENLHVQVSTIGASFAIEAINHFGGIDQLFAEDFSLFICGDFFCDDQFWLDFLPKFNMSLCDELTDVESFRAA